MTEIIPRWEWRTFTNDLGIAEANIRMHPESRSRESDEVYILSEVSPDNTKIRNDMMDVKTLRQVNEDRLEQWFPSMKTAFPLSVEDIIKVFECFRVAVPHLDRDEYSSTQFLDEILPQSKLLKAVTVHKSRTGFSINDCSVEIAEIRTEGKVIKTAAVEMEEPEQVIETVRELKLDVFPNINYLRGLQKLY